MEGEAPGPHMPATCRLSREEQGSRFQDMTVWAGVHLVARGVTDSREHPMSLGGPVQTSTSTFSDPAGTGQGAALLSQQSSPAAPLAWLDQVRDSPRTLASATLPLQLAPETLSEQKASAPLPSAQVRHAVQPRCNPCRARGRSQARRPSPRSRESWKPFSPGLMTWGLVGPSLSGLQADQDACDGG